MSRTLIFQRIRWLLTSRSFVGGVDKRHHISIWRKNGQHVRTDPCVQVLEVYTFWLVQKMLGSTMTRKGTIKVVQV